MVSDVHKSLYKLLTPESKNLKLFGIVYQDH